MGMALVACATAPEPPVVPSEVVALAERYQHPTAVLDPVTVRELLVRTDSLQGQLRPLGGLRFIDGVVTDATRTAASGQRLPDGVQGSITARAACRGTADESSPDEATNGTIELTIGIAGSRVQRALVGRATRCQLPTAEAEQREAAAVVLSAELEVDFGGPLDLGSPRSSDVVILMRHVSGSVGNDAFDLGDGDVHLRLTADGALETLVDVGLLGIGATGTAVLQLRDDAKLAVRVSDGEWVCGAGKDGLPCALGR